MENVFSIKFTGHCVKDGTHDGEFIDIAKRSTEELRTHTNEYGPWIKKPEPREPPEIIAAFALLASGLFLSGITDQGDKLKIETLQITRRPSSKTDIKKYVEKIRSSYKPPLSPEAAAFFSPEANAAPIIKGLATSIVAGKKLMNDWPPTAIPRLGNILWNGLQAFVFALQTIYALNQKTPKTLYPHPLESPLRDNANGLEKRPIPSPQAVLRALEQPPKNVFDMDAAPPKCKFPPGNEILDAIKQNLNSLAPKKDFGHYYPPSFSQLAKHLL